MSLNRSDPHPDAISALATSISFRSPSRECNLLHAGGFSGRVGESPLRVYKFIKATLRRCVALRSVDRIPRIVAARVNKVSFSRHVFRPGLRRVRRLSPSRCLQLIYIVSIPPLRHPSPFLSGGRHRSGRVPGLSRIPIDIAISR